MDVKTAQSLMAKAARDTSDNVAVLSGKTDATNARLDRIESALLELAAALKAPTRKEK